MGSICQTGGRRGALLDGGVVSVREFGTADDTEGVS